RLSARHGVGVLSVCADYFMERPLIRVPAAEFASSVERLQWLMGRCRLAGITRAVLPFVDHSRIENHDEMTRIVEMLGDMLPIAERNDVELHLETSLEPA